MRFLITGGAGFIGSHLADLLIAEGHRVTAVDDLSTGRPDNVAHLEGCDAFRLVRASVLEDGVMDDLAAGSEVIVHLAAAVGVDLIVRRLSHTIETNIGGTTMVLRAAARHGVKVMIASSSEVYDKGMQVPFRETDDRVMGGTQKSRWAYAESKAVDEFLAFAYHRERDLPIVIFRLFNTVGPRQTGRYGMVLPRFARAAVRGEPLRVHGDGTQTRCFLHVADAVRAVVDLALSDAAVGEIFNVGSEEEITITDLARRVIEAAGSSSRIEYVPYEEAYAKGFEDMMRRVPDTTRIRETLGWRPARSLEDILRDVIREYSTGQSGPGGPDD